MTKKIVIVLVLLIAALWIFSPWINWLFEEEKSDRPIVLEKRIALLDRDGPDQGFYLPTGARIQKQARDLGGMKRSFLRIEPGLQAVFEHLPLHAGTFLTFCAGAEKARDFSVEIVFETWDAERQAYRLLRKDRQAFRFERPEWQACRLDFLEITKRCQLKVTFQSSDPQQTDPLMLAQPVLHSNGRRTSIEDLPPILAQEESRNLVRDFGAAKVLQANPDHPPAVVPMCFDMEKRTQADEAQQGVWVNPDSAFAFTVKLQPETFLEVAAFVYPIGDFNNPQDPGNVEFAVEVEGETVFSVRSDFINGKPRYFNNPYDRLIRRARIDLGDWAGQEVDLVFSTTQIDQTVPIAGHCCWWDLRLIRDRRIPRRQASGQHPNVLVLCIDALRADHLGCYGYSRATSPNLDALAKNALVFEHAVSPCSWTLPATASLLTGLHPNTHGVLGNLRNYLVNSITTLAEHLAWRGVSTAAFSANELVCRAINFDQGFEQFIEVDEPAEGVNADLFSWLEERGPFQFFAYVHYMEPHSPYSAPGSYRQHFDPDYAEERDFSGPLPEAWRLGKIPQEFTTEAFQHVVSLYDSEIFYWDLNFKALLEKLEALSLRDHTIIVVTADHGEEFLDHGGLGHGLTLYNEVVQVPLIVIDPRLKQGARIKEFVSTTALFETVTGLAGYDPPASLQVKSLLPPAKIADRFERVYASTESNMPQLTARWAGMIQAPYKFITRIDGEHDELYHLSKDPQEQFNLLAVQPEEGARLKADLLDWYQNTARAFPQEVQPLTPEILERLKRLGYVDQGE